MGLIIDSILFKRFKTHSVFPDWVGPLTIQVNGCCNALLQIIVSIFLNKSKLEIYIVFIDFYSYNNNTMLDSH